jgi:hypothetical protein
MRLKPDCCQSHSELVVVGKGKSRHIEVKYFPDLAAESLQ